MYHWERGFGCTETKTTREKSRGLKTAKKNERKKKRERKREKKGKNAKENRRHRLKILLGDWQLAVMMKTMFVVLCVQWNLRLISQATIGLSAMVATIGVTNTRRNFYSRDCPN